MGRPARKPDCHPDKKHWGHGLCRDCSNKKHRELNRNNPEYIQKNRERARKYKQENRQKVTDFSYKAHLKERYGLTFDEYQIMVNQQNGLCAICNTPSNRRLQIDHDHATGKIRALLCHLCNKGLGCLKDNKEIMQAAILYLEKYA